MSIIISLSRSHGTITITSEKETKIWKVRKYMVEHRRKFLADLDLLISTSEDIEHVRGVYSTMKTELKNLLDKYIDNIFDYLCNITANNKSIVVVKPADLTDVTLDELGWNYLISKINNTDYIKNTVMFV